MSVSPAAALALFSVIASPVLAKPVRTDSERAEIESRFLWSHRFQGAVESLEITPRGFVHAVVRAGLTGTSREILDRSGRSAWRGDAATTRLIADDPELLILEDLGDSYSLLSVGGGSWRWRTRGVPAGILIEGGAAVLFEVGGGRLGSYPSERDASMTLVNLADGSERWTVALGPIRVSADSLGADLDAADGTVWAAADGRAAAVRLADGKVLWSSEFPRGTAPEGAWFHLGARSFFASGGRVAAFTKTGGLRWRLRLTDDEGAVPVGFVRAGDGVLAGMRSPDGVLLALIDPSRGRALWKFQRGRGKRGPPPFGWALAGDAVAVAADGALVGLEAASGRELYSVPIPEDAFEGFRSLRSVGEFAVLSGPNGAAAFGIRDGEAAWTAGGFMDAAEFRGSRERKFFPVARKSAWSAAQPGPGPGVVGLWEPRDLGLARILDPKRFSFRPASEVNAAVIDLWTGKVQESGVRRSAKACATRLLFDLSRNRVVQTHVRMGVRCRDHARIDVFRLAPEDEAP